MPTPSAKTNVKLTEHDRVILHGIAKWLRRQKDWVENYPRFLNRRTAKTQREKIESLDVAKLWGTTFSFVWLKGEEGRFRYDYFAIPLLYSTGAMVDGKLLINWEPIRIRAGMLLKSDIYMLVFAPLKPRAPEPFVPGPYQKAKLAAKAASKRRPRRVAGMPPSTSRPIPEVKPNPQIPPEWLLKKAPKTDSQSNDPPKKALTIPTQVTAAAGSNASSIVAAPASGNPAPPTTQAPLAASASASSGHQVMGPPPRPQVNGIKATQSAGQSVPASNPNGVGAKSGLTSRVGQSSLSVQRPLQKKRPLQDQQSSPSKRPKITPRLIGRKPTPADVRAAAKAREARGLVKRGPAPELEYNHPPLKPMTAKTKPVQRLAVSSTATQAPSSKQTASGQATDTQTPTPAQRAAIRRPVPRQRPAGPNSAGQAPSGQRGPIRRRVFHRLLPGQQPPPGARLVRRRRRVPGQQAATQQNTSTQKQLPSFTPDATSAQTKPGPVQNGVPSSTLQLQIQSKAHSQDNPAQVNTPIIRVTAPPSATHPAPAMSQASKPTSHSPSSTSQPIPPTTNGISTEPPRATQS